MDIVERLRMKGPMSFQMDWSDRAKAADEIERLREQVEFERASLRSAFGEMRKLDGDIERLREVIENMTNLSNNLWNIGAVALMGEEDA
jgi:hypothetical protein